MSAVVWALIGFVVGMAVSIGGVALICWLVERAEQTSRRTGI